MSRHRRALPALPARTFSARSKRFLRLLALLLLFGGMLGGIARPASAQDTSNRIDGNTYFGLDFGWSLTWDEDVWGEPVEEHVDGSEYVALSTLDEPFASGRVLATNQFEGDVDACVEGWEDLLRNSGSLRHIEPTEVESGLDLPRDAAEGAYSYDVKVDGTLLSFVEYVQCRPLDDDANLVLSFSATPSDYDEALPLFAELVDGIAFDDSQTSASNDADDETETGDRPHVNDASFGNDNETGSSDIPGGSGIDGNSYTSVNFDWSIEWDDRIWTPSPGLEDNSGGNDFVSIESTQRDGAPMMLVSFASTVSFDGDVRACAESAYDSLTDDGDSAISNVAEADVDLPEIPRNGAAAAYSYTYQEGLTEPMDFLNVQICLPLDNDGANLQIQILIPPDLYEDALPYYNDLIAAIEINLD